MHKKTNKYKAILLNILNNRSIILLFFMLLPLATTLRQYQKGIHNNNYLIFIYTYFHAADQQSLYANYPEYGDINHYGPLFALIIAPFAALPEFTGMYLWELVNCLFLYYAIQTLPLKYTRVNTVYWIIMHELLTALFECQINPAITAIIILSFTLIEQKKNFWAACLIMVGTFVKLYGIVGLACFFFVKQKPRFMVYCLFWAVICFMLPMLFFGPAYILQQYQEWYHTLVNKQFENASLVSWQDVSVMGMARRWSQNPDIPNLPFLITGLVIFCLPYLRKSQYQFLNFRLMYLASALIFAVIFSNSSEPPTYIIAFTGVALWFMMQQKPVSKMAIGLFILSVLLTTLATTFIYPKYIRTNYIKSYSLKALPCLLIWLYISYQLIKDDFSNQKVIRFG